MSKIRNFTEFSKKKSYSITIAIDTLVTTHEIVDFF